MKEFLSKEQGAGTRIDLADDDLTHHHEVDMIRMALLVAAVVMTNGVMIDVVDHRQVIEDGVMMTDESHKGIDETVDLQ